MSSILRRYFIGYRCTALGRYIAEMECDVCVAVGRVGEDDPRIQVEIEALGLWIAAVKNENDFA